MEMFVHLQLGRFVSFYGTKFYTVRKVRQKTPPMDQVWKRDGALLCCDGNIWATDTTVWGTNMWVWHLNEGRPT